MITMSKMVWYFSLVLFWKKWVVYVYISCFVLNEIFS